MKIKPNKNRNDFRLYAFGDDDVNRQINCRIGEAESEVDGNRIASVNWKFQFETKV